MANCRSEWNVDKSVWSPSQQLLLCSSLSFIHTFLQKFWLLNYHYHYHNLSLLQLTQSIPSKPSKMRFLLLTLHALLSVVLATPLSSTGPEVQIVGTPLTDSTPVLIRDTHLHLLAERATYAPSAIPSDYAAKVLMHHNIHRWNHTAVNMTYSSTLAGYAQTLASSCSYGHNTYVFSTFLLFLFFS